MSSNTDCFVSPPPHLLSPQTPLWGWIFRYACTPQPPAVFVVAASACFLCTVAGAGLVDCLGWLFECYFAGIRGPAASTGSAGGMAAEHRVGRCHCRPRPRPRPRRRQGSLGPSDG